jgi:hypothetical protein
MKLWKYGKRSIEEIAVGALSKKGRSNRIIIKTRITPHAEGQQQTPLRNKYNNTKCYV